MNQNNHTFKLLDFQVNNEVEKGKKGKDNKTFTIQMFGMNEKGETCSIWVKDFRPFFYIKVSDKWGKPKKDTFVKHIKERLRVDSLKDKYKKWKRGQIIYPTPEDDESEMEYIKRTKDSFVSYYENSITDAFIIENHDLYGFDNHKMHRFICLCFKNTAALNKVKNFWYTITADPTSLFGRKYKLQSFNFQGVNTELYEAKLPPLLRYFHIQSLNPSGWVEIPLDKIIDRPDKTHCKYEFQ